MLGILIKRITQKDKDLEIDLDYHGIEFPVWEKDFSKIETKNNICINVCCNENKLVFPIDISDQKYQNSMDLLLVIDGNKSHYVYVKYFDRFMFHKTKNKNKKYFWSVVCSVLVVKMCLQSIKKFVCRINGAQSVRLEIETIDFKKYFKQIPETFKIYADFECNLKCV